MKPLFRLLLLLGSWLPLTAAAQLPGSAPSPTLPGAAVLKLAAGAQISQLEAALLG